MTYSGQPQYGPPPGQYQQPQQYGQPQYQAPQQPQQTPQQPYVWQGTGDPLGAPKRPSISWGSIGQPVPVGTRRLLAVYEPASVRQQQDFDTGMPKVYPDTGLPVLQVVLGVVDENGEDRGLYFGRPSAGQAALLAAQEASGALFVAGSLIDITYVGDKPDPTNPKKAPAKQFQAAHWPGPACQQYMTQPQLATLQRHLSQPRPTDALGNGAAVQPAPPAQQPLPPVQNPTGAPGAAVQRYQQAVQAPAPPAYSQPGPVPPGGQQFAGAPAPNLPQAVQNVQQTFPGAQVVQQPAAPPQYGPPAQVAPPAPAPAGRTPERTFQGYSAVQLAGLSQLDEATRIALGHDAARVEAAMREAVAAGALPPF